MSATTARNSHNSVTRKSWISTMPFNGAIFSYSYGLDESLMREVGTFSLIPGATPDNCPAGRIVFENGRRSHPANGNFRGANDGAITYGVGVFDPISGISGFINPNGSYFAINNADKPNYLIGQSTDPITGRPNLGTPVLTNGFILSVSGTGPEGELGGSVGVVSNMNVDNNTQPNSYALAYNFNNNSNYPAIEVAAGTNNTDGAFDYIGMYGNDNSLWMGGLIYPGSAKGALTLQGNAGGSTVTSSVNPLLRQSGNDSMVILTRHTPGGDLGHLYYSIGGPPNSPTLTIRSSSATETSVINYLIIGVGYGGNPL